MPASHAIRYQPLLSQMPQMPASGWLLAILLGTACDSSESASEDRSAAPPATLHGPIVAPTDTTTASSLWAACGEHCCPIVSDVLTGSTSTDSLTAPADHHYDCLLGYDGHDTLTAAGDGSLLAGGEGNDRLAGGAGRDTILGEAGADEIFAGAGVDHVDGGPGDDEIEGAGSSDLIFGGDGDDIIWGETDTPSTVGGSDMILAGAGDDIVNTGAGNDLVFGGPGADTISGDYGHDILRGDFGPDTLDGGKGSDILLGGAGDDELIGGDDDDVLIGGPGADEVRGGDGNDTIYLRHPCEASSTEVLDGGAGDDVLITALTPTQLRLAGVSVSGFEKVYMRTATTLLPTCDLESETRDRKELVARAISSTSVWRDTDGNIHPADSTYHPGWRIWTRRSMEVLALVSEEEPGTEVGDIFDVFTPGGKLDIGNDEYIQTTVDNQPAILADRPLRLGVLEERNIHGQTIGYALERYGPDPMDHFPAFPVGTLPIPLAAPSPDYEAVRPICSGPNLPFPDIARALDWVDLEDGQVMGGPGRLPQDSQLPACGGNDCIAIPLFNANWNMLGSEEEDYFDTFCSEHVGATSTGETFLTRFMHGALEWSDPGVSPSGWSQISPGASHPEIPITNVLNFNCCDPTSLDDGDNCIAVGEVTNSGLCTHQPFSLTSFTYVGEAWVRAENPDENGVGTVQEAGILLRPGTTTIFATPDICTLPAGSPVDEIVIASLFTFSDTSKHEYGHVLGLSHSVCPADVMFALEDPSVLPMYELGAEGVFIDFLNVGDRFRARILYPPYSSGLTFPQNNLTEPWY